MDVQRELKLTNIQELSTLAELVTVSPTAERRPEEKPMQESCSRPA